MAFSRAVTLLGGSGAGQLAKMVNQICIAGLVQGLSEAIAFGEAIATPMRMTFANHDTGGRPHDSSAAQGRMPPQENIARIVARLRGETQDA